MIESFALLPSILLMLAALVPFIVVGVYARRERYALARGWAAARGCTYMKSNPTMVLYLPGTPIVGPQSRVQDYIEGKTHGGRTFCSFKFFYQTSLIPGSSVAVGGTALMVRLPTALPRLSLSREEFSDGLDKIFGGQDIELESEDFNRVYRVESPFEAFAYSVLHPRMMEWMMSNGYGMVPFTIHDQDVICWGGEEPDYETLDKKLALMCEFIDLMPEHVLEQYEAPLALDWTSHH